MSDPRFNSVHLETARRTVYQKARQEVFEACGWQTGCLGQFRGMVQAVEWSLFLPCRPDALLPSARFMLLDEEADQVHALETGLNTIGRFADNHIEFTNRCISRRHCVILVHTTGRCELQDTASLNGTFVNGVRVTGLVELTSGDVVQICNKVLHFLSAEDARRLAAGQRAGVPGESITSAF